MSSTKKLTDQEVVAKFQQLKQEITSITTKVGQLEQESEEYKLVIDTMEPLNPSRKCFRLVGGVLIERTVEEVLPALKTNQTGIQSLMDSLIKSYKSSDDELKQLQRDYNIKIQN